MARNKMTIIAEHMGFLSAMTGMGPLQIIDDITEAAQQQLTEDAEFEIIEPKQLENATDKQLPDILPVSDAVLDGSVPDRVLAAKGYPQEDAQDSEASQV